MQSVTTENYLKAIYKLSRYSKGAISNSSVAAELGLQSATVTDMIKKLHSKGLVKHVPYQGVTLTDKGELLALQIIRKHRLWETFLVKELGFAWDEVHDIAEQLEHVESTELINRLEAFLQYPTSDPHGDPIPTKEGEIRERKDLFLGDLKAGDRGSVCGVREDDKQLLGYLDQRNIGIGARFEVVQVMDFDGSMKLSIDDQEIFISGKIAENLIVDKG